MNTVPDDHDDWHKLYKKTETETLETTSGNANILRALLYVNIVSFLIT